MASFTSYGEAERAVDRLSDERFPVERVAIVAHGLRFTEQVTGRVGTGRAVLGGALSGGAVGLLFGWIFGLFNLINPIVASLTLALYGLVFGALVGALLGWLSHATTAGGETSPPWARCKPSAPT